MNESEPSESLTTTVTSMIPLFAELCAPQAFETHTDMTSASLVNALLVLRALRISISHLVGDGSMTPEAQRRNNWTKVSTIPWYEWGCGALAADSASDGHGILGFWPRISDKIVRDRPIRRSPRKPSIDDAQGGDQRHRKIDSHYSTHRAAHH